MVPEQISYSKPILENFIAFRREQNYIKNKDTKEEGNHLIDLNKKFKRIPFYLKYYDKKPSKEDVVVVRA